MLSNTRDRNVLSYLFGSFLLSLNADGNSSNSLLYNGANLLHNIGFNLALYTDTKHTFIGLVSNNFE